MVTLGAVPARVSLAGASLAAGLEYEPEADSQRVRLALESQWTDDFSADFGHLTEVDSGSNVEVSGGKLKIKGSGALNADGVYLTDPLDFSQPGRFTIEQTIKITDVRMYLGFAAAAALSYNDAGLKVDYYSGGIHYCSTSAIFAISDFAPALDEIYTWEFEWDTDKSVRIYVTGGVFSSRTLFVAGYLNRLSNVGFQINVYASATTRQEYDNFQLERGYKTDSPVATLADVDSGRDDSEWDMSSIAFAGSATGLTFQYACGNSASPSNWNGSWLSLAQLQAESDPAGRYFKTKIAVASDGATQREVTEGTVNVKVAAETSPAAPDIAVSRVSDTSASVTFSNPAAGVTNEVRYATVADGGDSWQDGGSRSGDGAVTVPGLVSGGMYYFAGFSEKTGARSEPSNVVIYTSGPASGAVGAYATFLGNLYAEVRNSAALAAKVSAGTPADHVKLGRFLNIDSDSERHAALVANGPVIYVRPRPYEAGPGSTDSARCRFSAELEIYEGYDQSGADDLLTAVNFVEALRQEIMSESDGLGTGASWLSCGGGVGMEVDGPHERAGLRDQLVTSVTLSAAWPESV